MRCFKKRREVLAASMLAAIVSLAAGACGGKGGGAPTDAGSDHPADTGATACDPVAQTCATAQKCDFHCQSGVAVIECIPGSDGGVVNSPCAAALPCARGTGCATTADAGSLCRRYCASDGDCATGERCHNDTFSVACGGPPTVLPVHFCY